VTKKGDTMVDHDKNVGDVLDHLDKLGITENTFVMYTTDNGPHMKHLAGWGNDAIPQRKRYELGRRISGAVACSVARPYSVGFDLQRDRAASRLAADVPCHGRWAGHYLLASQGIVTEFLKTFKEFPPRQKAASFTIDQALEKMAAAGTGGGTGAGSKAAWGNRWSLGVNTRGRPQSSEEAALFTSVDEISP
jgi:Sulfatase